MPHGKFAPLCNDIQHPTLCLMHKWLAERYGYSMGAHWPGSHSSLTSGPGLLADLLVGPTELIHGHDREDDSKLDMQVKTQDALSIRLDITGYYLQSLERAFQDVTDLNSGSTNLVNPSSPDYIMWPRMSLQGHVFICSCAQQYKLSRMRHRFLLFIPNQYKSTCPLCSVCIVAHPSHS